MYPFDPFRKKPEEDVIYTSTDSTDLIDQISYPLQPAQPNSKPFVLDPMNSKSTQFWYKEKIDKFHKILENKLELLYNKLEDNEDDEEVFFTLCCLELLEHLSCE
jgi:hypothetical protein